MDNPFLKRAIDFGVSAIGLVFFAPVLAVLVPIIRWQSPGPALFEQPRIGRLGKLFTCYKLRTMREDAPQVASHELPHSVITPLGAKLRHWKLDEVPQLYNVLRGDMSLVGPRPSLPTQTHLIEEQRKRGVLDVLPGITGLAQTQGIDMSDPDRLTEIDADYVAKRTLRLDIGLLASTISGKGLRCDAVRKPTL